MRLHRNLETVYLLLEKGRVTAKELASRFGVSERTVYRDVDALSAAGIPVYTNKGHGGGISLLPHYAPGAPALSDEERAEVLAALSAFGAVSPAAQTAALAKLSAMFADAAADWVEVDFAAWSGSDEERDKFDALKKAIIGRKKVTFVYFSAAGGAGETRRVCPLKLCFRGQSWYLFGRCETRDDDRFFKLRRIRELTVTDERHSLTAPARVTGAPLAAAPPLTATLAIDGKLAFRVYDEFGAVTPGENGELVVTAVYTRPEWLFAMIATYGAACRIVAPPSLREDLKKYLAAMLKNCD